MKKRKRRKLTRWELVTALELIALALAIAIMVTLTLAHIYAIAVYGNKPISEAPVWVMWILKGKG